MRGHTCNSDSLTSSGPRSRTNRDTLQRPLFMCAQGAQWIRGYWWNFPLWVSTTRCSTISDQSLFNGLYSAGYFAACAQILWPRRKDFRIPDGYSAVKSTAWNSMKPVPFSFGWFIMGTCFPPAIKPGPEDTCG